MKTITLIRHGKTPGNLEGRYIGRTDEGLSEIGREDLRKSVDAGRYPSADLCVVSPMLRCRETKDIIYGSLIPEIVVDDLRETDFGDFEAKNYVELSSDPRYQAWIDSNGSLPFPNGESAEEFRARCTNAFEKLVIESLMTCPGEAISFVVHGGTIMAILSAFAEEKQDYFTWQAKNGAGYRAILDFANGNPILRSVTAL